MSVTEVRRHASRRAGGTTSGIRPLQKLYSSYVTRSINPRSINPRSSGNAVFFAIAGACAGIWYYASDAVARGPYNRRPDPRHRESEGPSAVGIVTIQDGASNQTAASVGSGQPTGLVLTRLLRDPRSVITYGFVRDNLLLLWRNLDAGRPWVLLTYTLTHISSTHCKSLPHSITLKSSVNAMSFK